MEAKELVLKSLEQSQRFLNNALDGLTQKEVAWSPTPECNSIAFILWHTVRVEDAVVNGAIQRTGEVYETEGWREKLGTPPKETGGRYTLEQLRTWRVPKLEVLRGYAEAVRAKTLTFLQSVTPEKLSQEVVLFGRSDTVGGVLGFLSTEVAMHVGQIGYLRGVQRGLK